MQIVKHERLTSNPILITEHSSSIVFEVELPENAKFIKHAASPIVELSEKNIVIVQKVLRDTNSLSFKLKLNSEIGRVDLDLKFSVILMINEEKNLSHFHIVLPIIVSSAGQKEIYSKLPVSF